MSMGILWISLLRLLGKYLTVKMLFKEEIWMYFKKKMGNSGFSDRWDDLVEQYANKECNNSIGSILRRITLALTVYHIWKERNTRIFKNEVVDVKILLKIIADDIKLQLMGLQYEGIGAVKDEAFWSLIALPMEVRLGMKEGVCSLTCDACSSILKESVSDDEDADWFDEEYEQEM
ncbi:hypothetical protein Tco_0903642 [Tanacetum coccineum]